MADVLTASQMVRRWADRAPDQVSLSFYSRNEQVERLTYPALVRRISAHAHLFRKNGLRPGDAALIVAHSTPDFVAAFLGAQDAGLLAVPCPPPELLESARRVRQRMTEIVTHCRARALLNSLPGPLDDVLASGLAGLGITVLSSPDPGAVETAPAAPERIDRLPLAYCQFTSGSGGIAKGVLLTHENVAANVQAMHDFYAEAPEQVFVTWLPLFHDMGLVGYLLLPLLTGRPLHVMSPVAFISRPGSWLSLISRVRGTTTSAPNFAYALCARKVSDEEAAALDLSSWRVACNGSEPVTRAAVDAFIRRFAASGFQPGSMLPCYGLAEDTLCATSRRPGEGARFEELSRETLAEQGVARPEPGGAVVASVGWPLPGHDIVVRDSDGAPLADRRVGEVAVRGASVMHGYLPGTQGEVALTPDRWLLTGDLGYVADGELFVVGRKKDLIIRAGRNYYPADLEAAGEVPGVRAGRIVAFSVPADESERVIVAVERREEWTGDPAALRLAVRDAVFASVRVMPDEVLLLPRNTLPLTSSGKVMRPEARRLYLAGDWATG